MANNISLLNIKSKRVGFSELDGLIKFVLAIILAVMPFYFHNPVSYGILFVYLLLLTLFSDINPQTLLLSASSYFIIVLLPYLFGLLINTIITSLTGSNIAANYFGMEMLIRLVRLLIIWYVSILYFLTTPMKTVLGLLQKLFSPLKFLGVPVDDYLKVVMCTVIELKETGSEVKKSLAASMRAVLKGNGQRKFKLNIKGISQIIVSLIVNSFEKLDRIESFVRQVKTEDLYYYSLRFTKNELFAVMSFILLTVLVRMNELGRF